MDKIRAFPVCLRFSRGACQRAKRYVITRFKMVSYSIQDHATPLIITSYVLVVGGLALFVLYDTNAVTLVKTYQPVIALVAVLTGIAIRVHKWLKEKQAKRIAPPEDPPPDGASTGPVGSPAPLDPAVAAGRAGGQPAERL